ncbi:carboxymuconolactone decarboxylase [Dactylosporangium cerinum]|uniref:Carboxymuconolactone decarboxylase n=1 Tax=Dactylosporangium cerinum TaxID=1434730 RepID=A0ABV9VS72_9ACTN
MIAGRVASSVAQRQVRYVTPVQPAAATGLVSEIYKQVKDELLLVVPPALLHSPMPDLLAAYWAIVREPLLVEGAVGRDVKEAVAATVAMANTCPYCVEMHSVTLYELSTEVSAEAVATDHLSDVDNAPVRAATTWARSAHLDTHPGLAGHRPGTAGWAELAGVVVGLHYLSRMVNVYLSNHLLPPGLGPRARVRFKRGVSRLMRATLRTPRTQGRTLSLLPPAPQPPDAGWSAGSAVMAETAARTYAAFDAAGARSVPAAVRQIVSDRLEGWDGADPGLGADWCEPLIGHLPAPDRATARLALLTAFASYRVDAGTIAEFRRHRPGDLALLDTTAWASFAAARTIGARLDPAAGQHRTAGDAPGPRVGSR